MSETIWKFALESSVERAALYVPAHARWLTAQMQGNRPFAWAIVDPDAPRVRHVVYLVRTGDPLPDAVASNVAQYIGTVQLYAQGGAPFVIHVHIDSTNEDDER